MSDSHLRYEVIIYWSQDDEAFITEMPELPGAAAGGQTAQEALSALQLVASELGRPIPQPGGRLLDA